MQQYPLPATRIMLELRGMHMKQVAASWAPSMHKHTLFELNAVLKGQQILEMNGLDYTMKQGDLAIIRPGERHRFKIGACPAMTYFCVHFDLNDPALQMLLLRSSEAVLRNNSEWNDQIQETLQKLASYIRDHSSDGINPIGMYAHIFQLLDQVRAALTLNSHDNRTRCSRSTLANQIAYRIEQLIADFRNNFRDKELDGIQGIANSLGISDSHCNQVFQDAYHMSPRQYLSSLILREAKTLLTRKDVSIEQIAHQLGYADTSHFSRQFKRWTGQSPSAYRNGIT